jgi:hypothetical protein
MRNAGFLEWLPHHPESMPAVEIRCPGLGVEPDCLQALSRREPDQICFAWSPALPV